MSVAYPTTLDRTCETTAGWSRWSADTALSLVTDNPQHGLRCLRCETLNPVQFNGTYSEQMVTVLPNTQYTASVYVRSPTTDAFSIQIQQRTAVGGFVANNQQNLGYLPGDNVWRRYTLTFTTAATTERLGNWRVYNNENVETEWYVDGWQLDLGATAQAYDGPDISATEPPTVVRRFTGSDGDNIRAAIGNCNISGAVTIAGLVKPRTAQYRTWLNLLSSTEAGIGYALGQDSPTYGTLWNGSTEDHSPAGFYELDEWTLIAVSKASGSQPVSWSRYNFSTDTWTHDNPGSLSDASPVPGGFVEIGAYEGGSNPTADFAALAIWNTNLSTGQIETLVDGSLEEWDDLNPSGLWLFNQISLYDEVLEDLTGGGADEAVRSGTSLLLETPPIPYKASTPAGIPSYVRQSGSFDAATMYTKQGGVFVPVESGQVM